MFIITTTFLSFALLVGLISYEFGTLDREIRYDGVERAISAALGDNESVAIALGEHSTSDFAFRVQVGRLVYGFREIDELIEWVLHATNPDSEQGTSSETLHYFGAVVVSHPSLGF